MLEIRSVDPAWAYELDDSICRAKKNNGVGSTRDRRLGKARLVGKRGRVEQQGLPSLCRLPKRATNEYPKERVAHRVCNPFVVPH
jgi:hypothetical protein